MGSVNENTEILTGIVEKGSTVHVSVAGQNIRASVNESGVFTLPLPTIKAGDQLVVHCEDAKGNVAEAAVTVALGTRGAIQVVVPLAVNLTQPIQISGTATANREIMVRMSVGGEERLSQLVHSDTDGMWAMQADPVRFNHGERVDVLAAYSDGLSPGSDGEDYFMCDSQCELAVDQARLTEDMTSISGTADPGAVLTLTYAAGTATVTVGEEGRFAFDELTLKPGTQVMLSAIDGMGNAAQLSWQVEPGDRENITLAIPSTQAGYINSYDDSLILTGTARRNLGVSIDILGESRYVETDDRGAFSIVLDPDRIDDGLLSVSASYADGFRPECSAYIEMLVDKQAPSFTTNTIGNNEIEVTTNELIVKTEPGTELILRAGRSESRETADAQGSAVFSLNNQKAGTSYTLTAIDAAGNETEQTITVIKQIRDVRVQIVRPTAGEVVLRGRLGVDVHILQTAPIDLYYTITNNGEELVRGEVPASEMSDLRDRDYQQMAAQYDDLKGEYVGKRMRANVTLPQIQSDSLLLSIYSNDEGTEPELLTQQYFASGEEEKIDGVGDEYALVEQPKTVHQRVTSDTFAFGLDEVSAQAFAPSQVYLTGYHFSEGNRTPFFDYIIDGKRYTMQQIDEAGGSAKATFASRDVEKEFGTLAPGLKKVNTRRGGVILLLDLSFLQEGEHEIQVVLINNSTEYLLESRKIVISSSVETDRNISRTLQGSWK